MIGVDIAHHHLHGERLATLVDDRYGPHCDEAIYDLGRIKRKT